MEEGGDFIVTMEKAERVTFGLFEADLHSGELWKAGYRIKLPRQPFRVLAELLVRAGDIVTREELQHEIWGENTNVDFDQAIAAAINKIREALGDSAENPRFIQTLTKRGYRFIAPVSSALSSRVAVETFPHESGHTFLQSVKKNDIDTLGSESATPLPKAVSVPLLSTRRRTIVTILITVLGLIGVSSLITFSAVHTNEVIRPPQVRQLTESSEVFAGLPNFENLPVLVTDGPRIYTSSLTGGRAQVSWLELSEGRLQPIRSPDEVSPATIADLSPDGSQLLLRSKRSRESEQPLWIVPISGSTALRVGDVLAHDATWMPGGKGVLYATGNELGVVQLDTGETKTLFQLSGRAFWPRWSPDGTLLRFTLVDPITHASNLWELESQTNHLRQLHFVELSGMALCCGAWMTDGKTYVFEASSPHESNIWSVETGRKRVVRELTNGPFRYLSPLPSHDGRTVYFIGLEQPASTRLYDRKLQSFIPAPRYLANAQRISYSRDGTWVAWTDADSRLLRARSADGSERLQLTGNNLEVFMAQWSPDSTHLVLMARKPGETWKIYSMNAEGGGERMLLADKRNLADPDWSPDGRRIVFGREADQMGKESGPRDIEFLNLANQQVQKLEGSDNLFSPRWSPDGRWIAALSLDQTRIAIYDTQYQIWKTLFHGSAADPVWSSDSKSLYFHAFAESGSPIMRVSLAGNSESIADLTKLGLPVGDNYFFSGVTEKGSPLIKPSVGSGNLYSVTIPR
ncbi:MAG: winged helix-turn-helix domain-containing protein [Janthinobacterium lividum]